VPVQVVLPPVEVGRWDVEIDAEDRFLSAEVSGSEEAIARLRSGAEAVIALASLSSDDLTKRVESKEVSFAVLRGGTIQPSGEFAVSAPRATVRVRITPRGADGNGP
jgi:hypothetical protein